MVAAGHVYRLYVGFINPPKTKLLVLAYVAGDGRLRFFVINSDRTELQKTRDEIRKHVIAIHATREHPFLTHDSWLNCHELLGGWTAAQLEGEIASNPEKHIGILDADVLARVRGVVSESRLLSTAEKDLILRQWPR